MDAEEINGREWHLADILPRLQRSALSVHLADAVKFIPK
jgi:hypothetical protein